MTPTKEEWNSALKARLGAKLFKRFSGAAVAVCGLGGLGSNIAMLLARSGVGKLILIDFDRVDIANLHRQDYKACQVGMFKAHALEDNIREAAPWTNLTVHTEKITEENLPLLLSGADVICEAFDDAAAKAMLVSGVSEHFPRSFIVAASGMGGLFSPNGIITKRITKKLYLCGDGVSDADKHPGPVAPRVMLCAAHQAHTVLRILAEEYEV